MIEIKAPNPLVKDMDDYPRVFLAGSIEQDTAERWQQRAVELFAGKDVILYNPRRDAWDNTLEQSAADAKLREQITWELDALEQADYVIVYFDPATKSPISLLELGLFKRKCIVICPTGFWRKGNVDMVCERYGVLQVATLEDAVASILRIIA